MTNNFVMLLQLETLSKDQLVSEDEKAALHTRWLALVSKKCKKPAPKKDVVQMDGVPVVTLT